MLRLDSDILWNYGRINDKATGRQVAPSNSPEWRAVDTKFKANRNIRKIVAAKSKLISWVVSNCDDDPSERMKLVRALQKHVPVSIYGKCDKPCNNCKDQLARDYYYYLAFENSLATDYVTEKVYTMLGNGLIPVVYGGADYSKFLPPRSYINAQDFGTAKELADYLIALVTDKDAYLSYFWWQDFYTATKENGYANLCGRLWDFKETAKSKSQFYTDLKLWEHGDTWRNRTIKLV